MPVIDAPVRRYQAEVPGEPRGIAAVRAEVRAALVMWGIAEDAVYDTLLVVSELTSNGLVHGERPGKVSVDLEQPPDGESAVALAVEVHDSGAVTLALIAAVTGCADGYDDGEGAVCGRGLKLVHGLGWRLHLVIDRNGKTVRAARTIAA